MATTKDDELLIDDSTFNSAVSQVNAEKPTYAGTFDQQLQDIYDKISNREKFSYDVNADPLYQQYKNNYIQQGKLAMKDTVGQGAALTGGYDNTYAQQVGQQAYDAYLQNLGDVVPDLYSLAYGTYQDEGDNLLTQYSLVGDQRDTEYNRYRDELEDYEYDQQVAREQEQEEYERRMTAEQIAREQEQTEYERRISEEETTYNRQQQAYSNLYAIIKASGYTPTDSELAAAGMTREAATALQTEYNRSIGTTTSGGSSSGSYSSETAAIQQQLNALGANLVVDGIWGSKTQAAYEKYMGGNDDDTDNTLTVAQVRKNAKAELQAGTIDYDTYKEILSSLVIQSHIDEAKSHNEK